jgi:hypothetical protein
MANTKAISFELIWKKGVMTKRALECKCNLAQGKNPQNCDL